MFFRFCLLLLLSLGIAVPAQAEDYMAPSWENLARTLVRFSAVKLSDPPILNDYATLTACDLYETFHPNDFQWKRVQDAVLESARNHIAVFPTGYTYDTPMDLDRYDFQKHFFRLTERTSIRRVNAFLLLRAAELGCGVAEIRSFPHQFRAVLLTPLTIEGLPLAPKDAQELLSQMEADKNTARQIYARFNLRITFIAPLIPMDDHIHYSQDGAQKAQSSVLLNARLDSVDFYKDPARTQLIYHQDDPTGAGGNILRQDSAHDGS